MLYEGAFTLAEAIAAVEALRPVRVGAAPTMSLAVRVIRLDVDAGRVVKGVNFVDLRDAGDPVELAAAYGDQAPTNRLLDITASSASRETTYDVVKRNAVFIPLTVGGGVRTVEDFDRLLRAGRTSNGVNTAAIADPSLITKARSASVSVRCSQR